MPAEEQLSLLPFRVSELAGFKIGGVIAGRAVMLTDGALEPPAKGIDTHILVAIAAGAPAQAADRDRFAHEVFASVPNLKDVRINSSEPLRIGGQQGHQIMARGTRRRDRRRDHDRAVAALRRQRLSAPGRRGALGRLDAGLCPLPAGARRD